MNIYIYQSKEYALTHDDILQVAKWHKCNGDKVTVFDSMESLSEHAMNETSVVDCILLSYEQRDWQDIELELRLIRAMHLNAMPFTFTKFYALHKEHVAYCDRSEVNGVILKIENYSDYIDQFCQLSAKDVTFQSNWVANVKTLSAKPVNNVVRIY